MTKNRLKALRSSLTYRLNRMYKARDSGVKERVVYCADQVVKTATKALEEFQCTGYYPDDWHRWTRAVEDAELVKRCYEGDWLRG